MILWINKQLVIDKWSLTFIANGPCVYYSVASNALISHPLLRLRNGVIHRIDQL